jgi:hypothetical protein
VDSLGCTAQVLPHYADVTATAATGGDDPGPGGATLGAYYDAAPAGPKAQKVSRRPLQADQRSSDVRQLHNVDRATRSGIEVSKMPRPMTGTARASTSSAFAPWRRYRCGSPAALARSGLKRAASSPAAGPRHRQGRHHARLTTVNAARRLSNVAKDRAATPTNRGRRREADRRHEPALHLRRGRERHPLTVTAHAPHVEHPRGLSRSVRLA